LSRGRICVGIGSADVLDIPALIETTFPAGFLWGAATSAYQIEGSPLADGAGASIWHRFAHTPGKIADNSNGDVACDHYRRFAEDVQLMRDLGIQAYRFSVSWPRVMPVGIGRLNRAGIDFYSRLVDTLLEHEIQPVVTLYHWDLPAALEDRGGWAAPEVADWFAEYADVMFRSLAGRVRIWATINEPWVVMDHGYVEGEHAPGKRDLQAAAAVAKNLLRAHAAAVQAGRSAGDFQIGLVVNLVPVHPASESTADRAAAARLDAYINRQFLDPALLGESPPELAEIFGRNWQPWDVAELTRLQQPLDFVGVNYYLRLVVRDDATNGPTRSRTVQQADCPHSAMGWEIYPQGLTDTLQWINKRYANLPVYITENGAAFDDRYGGEDIVDDPLRVQYLRSHLLAARQAIDAGVNLRGYFVWSLLDNFEWGRGFSKRFGVVYVDFPTQRRVPKLSARFYSEVMRNNGLALVG
jgi:beta-glucosidase